MGEYERGVQDGRAAAVRDVEKALAELEAFMEDNEDSWVYGPWLADVRAALAGEREPGDGEDRG